VHLSAQDWPLRKTEPNSQSSAPKVLGTYGHALTPYLLGSPDIETALPKEGTPEQRSQHKIFGFT